MKKAFTIIRSIIQGVRLYAIIAVDRLLMATLIGLELPSIHYDKDLPKITEKMKDKQILKIKNQSRDNRNQFMNGYYKSARKRVRRATGIAIGLYLINWLIF